jgi:hypothetical protein
MKIVVRDFCADEKESFILSERYLSSTSNKV